MGQAVYILIMRDNKNSCDWRLLLAVLTLVFTAATSGCSVSNELAANEKALLLVPADLAAFGIKPEKLTGGKFSKTTSYLDRSIEYKYELESTDPGFYLSNTLTIDSSSANSLLNEGAQKTGLALGLKAAGVVSEEMKTAKNYGDRSSLSLLKLKEKPIGNLFVSVIGNKTYVVLISGFYFDDAGLFDELISPKLDKVTQFKKA